jgi:hypothetical protein
MTLQILPLSFTAAVMLLIFVVLLVGTGIAYWKMLTDPAVDARPFVRRNQPLPAMAVARREDKLSGIFG